MKKYVSFNELDLDYHNVCQAIKSENSAQFPNACFLSASAGNHELISSQSDEQYLELIVLFDVEKPNELLYVSVIITDDDDFVIDDYYLMETSEAFKQLNLLEYDMRDLYYDFEEFKKQMAEATKILKKMNEAAHYMRWQHEMDEVMKEFEREVDSASGWLSSWCG